MGPKLPNYSLSWRFIGHGVRAVQFFIPRIEVGSSSTAQYMNPKVYHLIQSEYNVVHCWVTCIMTVSSMFILVIYINKLQPMVPPERVLSTLVNPNFKISDHLFCCHCEISFFRIFCKFLHLMILKFG